MNPGDGTNSDGTFDDPFDRGAFGGRRGRHQGHPAPGGATLNEALATMARLFLDGRRTMIATVALVLVPYQLIAGIFVGRAVDAGTIEAVVSGQADPGTLTSMVTAVGITMIIGLALSVIVAGAIVATAHAGDLALSAGTALRIGVDRSGATLGAHVLLFGVMVAAFLAAALLMSPLVMIAPPLGAVIITFAGLATGLVGIGVSYLVIPAAVLEARGPVASLRRGMSVAWRGKGRLAGVMMIVVFGLLAVAMIGSILAALATMIAPAMTLVIDTTFMVVMTLVSAPATALAGYVVWLHVTAGGSPSPGAAQ